LRGNRRPEKAIPRLHYHGVIYFTNIDSIRWFLMYGAVDLSRVCSYNIEPIKDRDQWVQYCTKQEFLKWPVVHSYHYDTISKVPVGLCPRGSRSEPAAAEDGETSADTPRESPNGNSVSAIARKVTDVTQNIEDIVETTKGCCKRIRTRKK